MIRELSAEKFGKKVAAMRGDVSLRKLGRKSGVSFSLIGGIENGRRSGGKRSLEKLGRCFGLRGQELEDFIEEGLTASGRDKLLEPTKQYAAVVYNLLARRLSDAGISPLAFTDVIVPDPQRPLPKSLQYFKAGWRTRVLFKRKSPDLILRGRDGSTILVEIKIKRS
jgi:transcriptional regulator with XRE-family HTH domain